MIKIGIVLMPDSNWLGGAHYYRNLINAAKGSQIEFVAITDFNRDVDQLKSFQCSEIIKTKLFKRFSFTWVIRQLSTKLFKSDFLLKALLRKHNVSLLTHSGWLGKYSKIPTIGWIPDFQHIHLPDFFTKAELEARNKVFLDICTLCTKVVVSSYDALNDLKQFHPESVSKAVVMQFAVPPIKHEKQLATLEYLKSRYGFNSSFFLLPNQFWAHKNHQVVIDALAILKEQGEKVTVLATGNTSDYRQPGFFEALKSQIHSKKVTEEFKILGMVPQSDLNALFHYANAILNPSLFEGWSTVVEEAKMLGKKVILSNIAIHQEQNPKHAFYFNPSDAEELAYLLSQHNFYENISKKASLESYQLAKNNFDEYGQAYQKLVHEVLASKS